MVVPSAGSDCSATLAGVSAPDVDVTFRVKTDETATGGSPAYVYATSRREGSNAYRPKLIFNTNGSIAVHASRLVNGSETALAPPVVVPGLSHAADAFIWVRASVTGTDPTTVRVKAWADGSNQPALWLFEATDSTPALQAAGSVGLHAYLGSASYSVPLLFSFDDYVVVAPD